MKKIVALLLLSFSVQAGVTFDWEINLLDKVNQVKPRSAKKRPATAPSFSKVKSEIDAKELRKLTPAQQKGLERLQKTVDAGRDGMRKRDKTRLAIGKLKDKGDEVKSGIKKR